MKLKTTFLPVLLFAVLATVLVMGVMATPVEQEDMTEYNFLSKLKNFLKHFGHDGVAFIKCMGKDIEKGHCLKDIEHCGEAVVIQQTGIKYKDW